ncbi:hypothetical protein C8R43DRAFT_920931, partial [Mycena crocata]
MVCLGSVFISLILRFLFTQVPFAHAQDGQIFKWGFTDTEASTLPSCHNMRIAAKPLLRHGVPPFYMIALAVSGTPITTFIGTNASDLAWTVQHPIGTQLVLGVVDSQGTSGGIDPPLYTVIEGKETECMPAITAEPTFTIAANVTDALSTCEPWGLTIRGGTPPYNFTFAALDAPGATNVTFDDAAYTYINRVPPQTQLIASVSDVTGRWASGSPFVRTEGSPNLDCLGILGSNAGTQPNTTSPITTSTDPTRRRVTIIVGACAGALLLLCIALIYIVWRQRRTMALNPEMPQLDPFHGLPSTTPSSLWSPAS